MLAVICCLAIVHSVCLFMELGMFVWMGFTCALTMLVYYTCLACLYLLVFGLGCGLVF